MFVNGGNFVLFNVSVSKHFQVTCRLLNTLTTIMSKSTKVTRNASKLNLEVENPISNTQYEQPIKSTTKRKHLKVEPETPEQKPKYVPPNWELVLNNIREMRKEFNAPVDSMGFFECCDEQANPQTVRYQRLIALMLSSRTKDEVTHAAMLRLIAHGCTVDNILATSDEELGKLIIPVGFWKNKVKFIKKTTEILKNQYHSDIPQTVEDLCNLPGVGPKMANLCMHAWGKVTGIGVDVHVHRISNRLGWVKTKLPEETQRDLEDWLPSIHWKEVNHLLVGFGQQICLPKKPLCETCMNKQICPFNKKP